MFKVVFEVLGNLIEGKQKIKVYYFLKIEIIFANVI